jgi:tripartite-type tricarboxylate transporter receptor subunit TctC
MVEGRAGCRNNHGVTVLDIGASDRDAFPGGPIRLIVGFSPTSASDLLARALAPELSRVLGQPVSLERHDGAEGVRAARVLMDSVPDGRSLLIATLGSLVLNPGLVADLPYHPLRDFTPVALLMRAPLVLGVHPGLGIGCVAELVERARENPGQLRFGCSAVAGAPRLAGELFRRMAQVDMGPATYRETETLYSDLIASRIAFSFNNPMTMLPLIDRGQVTGIAVTGRERCRAAPNLPTMEQCGFAQFEVVNWVGVVAPAGLAPERTMRLNDAIRDALGSPSLQAELTRQGVEVPSDTPAEFAEHIGRETARWAPVLRDGLP